MKARFSEIIDLTGDDELHRHPKRNRILMRSASSASPLNSIVGAEYGDRGGGQTSISRNTRIVPPPTKLQYRYHSTTTNGPSTAPARDSEPLQADAIPNPFKNNAQIIQPIDQAAAHQKLGFNPSTIARDILIASGKHPFEAGLNAHLEVLKSRYAYVNDYSDLSTFRWDLVDPSTRPASFTPASGARGVTQSTRVPQNHLLAPSLHVLNSLSFHRPAILLKPYKKFYNSLGHPRMHPIETVPLDQSLAKDAAQERPVAYSAATLLKPVMQPNVKLHGSQEPAIQESLYLSGHGHGRPSQLRYYSTPSGNSPTYAVAVTSPSPSNPQSRILPPKKPESESRVPVAGPSKPIATQHLDLPAKSVVNTTSILSGSFPASSKKRSRPFGDRQDTDIVNSSPNKRGRPLKLAGPIKSAEKITAESPPTDLIPKKRGRPSKARKSLVFLPPPDPVFHSFLCEWKNCHAELHNLDTLRHHLFNVHIRRLTHDGLVCLWAECGEIHGDVNSREYFSRTLDKHNHFHTKTALRDHIQNAHLVPFAWHMGDGPRGTPLTITENQEPRTVSPWLFDLNGKQVTPSLESLPIEDGHPKENNTKRFMKKREGLHLVLVPIESSDAPHPTARYDFAHVEDETGMIIDG